jgi:hypothetical protein
MLVPLTHINRILASLHRMKHAGEDAFSYLQNVLFKTVIDAVSARNTK